MSISLFVLGIITVLLFLRNLSLCGQLAKREKELHEAGEANLRMAKDLLGASKEIAHLRTRLFKISDISSQPDALKCSEKN